MHCRSSSTAVLGSEGVVMTSREVNLPLASARAMVVCPGRMSTPMMTRSSLRRRNVGRRPRGRRPVGPSMTQDSLINCSTIKEMVLRCKPQRRARSAREMGWRVRMRLRTMRRLISRTTSLDAPWMRLGSITPNLRSTAGVFTPPSAMLSKDRVEVGNLPDGLAAADADPHLVFGQLGRGDGKIDFAGFTGTEMNALESAELAHGVVRPAGAADVKLDHFVALAVGRVHHADGNLRAAGCALGAQG